VLKASLIAFYRFIVTCSRGQKYKSRDTTCTSLVSPSLLHRASVYLFIIFNWKRARDTSPSNRERSIVRHVEGAMARCIESIIWVEANYSYAYPEGSDNSGRRIILSTTSRGST